MDFLKCIDAGIKHPTPAVRNSALYALGQFSDYLQVIFNPLCFILIRLAYAYIARLIIGVVVNSLLPSYKHPIEKFIVNFKHIVCLIFSPTSPTSRTPSSRSCSDTSTWRCVRSKATLRPKNRRHLIVFSTRSKLTQKISKRNWWLKNAFQRAACYLA